MQTLKIQRLVKSWEDFTLVADFSVASHHRAGLVGKSGSGKTTLLRLIAGLEVPDAGQILLGQEDLTYLPVKERAIGLIFQDQALFPNLNVLDNITFGLRMRGVPKDEREAKAMPWLERVDLKRRVRAPISQLSGGERQRVAFIRALIWEPKILLLDEPFSALDRELRKILCSELVALHQLWPVPLLLVSHDQNDLEAVATDHFNFRVETKENRSTTTVCAIKN